MPLLRSSPYVVGGWTQSRNDLTWRECRMDGSPLRPRLAPSVARRVPREAGRLHSEMSRHASRGSRWPRILAHDREVGSRRSGVGRTHLRPPTSPAATILRPRPVLTRRQALLASAGAGLLTAFAGIRSRMV